MTIEWTIPIGTVALLAVQFLVGIFAIVRGFRAMERSIDLRFGEINVKLNTFQVGDLRELKASVDRLNAGQDEWTKTLRDRTHQLGTEITGLVLRVDRLERPERYNRRKSDPKE